VLRVSIRIGVYCGCSNSLFGGCSANASKSVSMLLKASKTYSRATYRAISPLLAISKEVNGVVLTVDSVEIVEDRRTCCSRGFSNLVA
jgi:hypothetical protein